MKKLTYIIIIILACSITSGFSFFDNVFRSDKYLDDFYKEYINFMEEYDKGNAKKYFKAYKEAYFLLVDNYIYEIDKDRKNELFKESKKHLKDSIKYLQEEKKEVNAKNIMEYVASQTFNNIDAHTTWLPAEDAKRFLDSLSGKHSGIGIMFNYDNEKQLIRIIKVFEGGPAFKSGLKKEDYIYAVNNQRITKEQSIQEIVESIRGEKDTKVKLSIKRNQEMLYFDVIRGDYYVPSVEYEIINNKYGYITINSFNHDSASLFRNALLSMKVNTLNGLIIDVRDNSGGLLPSVVLIADSILKGDKITSIKGRNIRMNQSFISMNKAIVNEAIPIVILTNFMSASASELLAGSLGFNNRATLIGSNTFGKWSVQISSTLKDKSLLNITTQLFYAPNNKTFQGDGVPPDILILNKNSNKETREKDVENALKAKDIGKKDPKIRIQEKRCNPYNKDFVLGCAILFLESSQDYKVFEKRLK